MHGTALAALVFDGAACVGWCQFGPTATLPRIKNRKEYDRSLTALPDWRITCFFVAATHRHQGVARLALKGAVAQIASPRRRHGRGLPRRHLCTENLVLVPFQWNLVQL